MRKSLKRMKELDFNQKLPENWLFGPDKEAFDEY